MGSSGRDWERNFGAIWVCNGGCNEIDVVNGEFRRVAIPFSGPSFTFWKFLAAAGWSEVGVWLDFLPRCSPVADGVDW